MRAKTPRFKPHLHVSVVPGEAVFLLSERQYFLLEGPIFAALAPLCDGNHNEAAMLQALKGLFPPTEIYYALGLLRRDGFLEDGDPPAQPEREAYWHIAEVEGCRPEPRSLPKVAVEAIGISVLDPLKRTLREAGLTLDDPADVTVLVTDHYLDPAVTARLEEHHQAQHPVLLLRPVGVAPWIGPLLTPTPSPCFACLHHRLQGNQKIETYLTAKGVHSHPPTTAFAALPSTYQTAYATAVTELVKWWQFGGVSRLTDNLVTFDTLHLALRDHRIVRRPQCAVCGQPTMVAQGQQQPVVLSKRVRRSQDLGGFREESAQQTYDRLVHHLSPITGLVTQMREVYLEQDDHQLTPSYVTDHNFALIEAQLDFSRERLRGRSGGKGKTPLQAKVGAICESLERYSGVFQGDEATVHSTMAALEGAIHPNDCMLFSEQQLRHGTPKVGLQSLYNWVPQPFDPGTEVAWTPVWSLTHGRRRYLPAAYCWYGYARAHNAWFARADANGCAAGASVEEAVLQGFLELVERDAVAIWWYNRLRRPRLDLESFGDPYYGKLSDYFARIHFDFWVLDITSDLGIPTFAAITRRNDREDEDLMFGFGAHFDAGIALQRAVTELNQLLPAVFSKNLQNGVLDCEAKAWWNTARLDEEPYLAPDKGQAPRKAADFPTYTTERLDLVVADCVRIAAEKGLETLVLDQTRPDTGLHVVKVLVPGLRHFWARFGPGRLYDVPVAMGDLPNAHDESNLNPRFLFV